MRGKAYKKRKDIKRWLKALFSVICVAAAAFLLLSFYRYLVTTPYLQIKEIMVVGGKRVSSQEIMDIAGLKTGINTLSIDLGEVRNRIEKLPWVKEVQIRRVLTHGLKVSVVERKPFVLIDIDNTLYLMDEDGVVFKEADYADKVDLPIITGIGMEELLEGESSVTDLLFSALDLVKLLSRKNTVVSFDKISELRLISDRGIALCTNDDNMTIYLGKDDFVKKLNRLETLKKALGNAFSMAGFIDLNYKDKVVVKWRT